MQTIYADVLIILNVYVNFFLLRITAAITSSPLKTGRCIAASFYGSLFSFLILAPELSSFLVTAIKLSAAVTVVMLAFGIHGKMRLLKNTAAFFCANFILAGTVSGVYNWVKPDFVHIGNSYFYVDFSLVILLASTAGLYLAVRLVRRFSFKEALADDCFSVVVRYRGETVELTGFADTGNILTDFFTGSPVIVCGREAFLGENKDFPQGFRLLPCGTVSGDGLMPIFRPDEVFIRNSLSGEQKPVNAMIGLGESSDRAVFNPKLLKR